MKKLGIIRFPGTNCDRDIETFAKNRGWTSQMIWHLDQFAASAFQAIIVPGGFSYGDYLRSGALAARSPIMKSVREFASQGGPVLGICNGFQILTEAGLLPGALLQNMGRRFIDDDVELEVVRTNSYWAPQVKKKIHLPIAHGDGRYFIDPDELKKLYDHGQVWIKYVKNPNGSIDDIAGVTNQSGNVAGLMPHPERSIEDWMGGTDGRFFL